MRKDNISILRAITTLLVVLFHALGCYTYGWGFPYDKILAYEYFDLFINKINMPLFTAMSGYLYAYGLNNGKYTNSWNVIIVKAKHLLIPYVIWSIVQIIIFPGISVSSILEGCLHLWFLLMLFGLFCTFSLIRGIMRKLSEKTLFIILIFMFLLPIFLRVTNLFALNSVISMAVFFYAGMLLQQAKINIVSIGGDCPKTHKSVSTNVQIVIDDRVFPTSASCSNFDLQCKTIESEVGSFRLKGKIEIENSSRTVWGGGKKVSVCPRNGWFVDSYIILW